MGRGGVFGFGGAQGEGGLEPQWSAQDKAARLWEWGSGEMDAGNPPEEIPQADLSYGREGSHMGSYVAAAVVGME